MSFPFPISARRPTNRRGEVTTLCEAPVSLYSFCNFKLIQSVYCTTNPDDTRHGKPVKPTSAQSQHGPRPIDDGDRVRICDMNTSATQRATKHNLHYPHEDDSSTSALEIIVCDPRPTI